ncbi:hypothetical protein V8F20_007095 [Naviculisporaceae sp. PSN 640]
MIRLKYFLLICFVAVTLAAELDDDECPVNIPGYTHHGACDLFCKEASWTDVAVFFFGNYVVHAATVISNPGQPIMTSIATVIIAILFPGSGMFKALSAIYSQAVFAPMELQQAARAGALCVVRKRNPSEISSRRGKTEEAHSDNGRVIQQGQNGTIEATTEPEVREDIEEQGRELRDRGVLSTTTEDDYQKKLHGICRLPKGYYLATVPRDATFVDDPSQEELDTLTWTEKGLLGSIESLFRPRPRRTHISYSYNLVKIAVSVGQLSFACFTLYRIRGDQITRFGYAAFSLTVVQYAWMSFLNLLGNMMRPEYPTMFLVESESLDSLRELLRRQSRESDFPISGVVGRVSPGTEERLAMAKEHYFEPKLSLLIGKLAYTVWCKSLPPRWLHFFEWLHSELDLRARGRRLLNSYCNIRPSRYPGAYFDTEPQVLMDFIKRGTRPQVDMFLLSTVPIAIIGGISRFSPGASELYQRVWTMIWPVFGLIVGPFFSVALEQQSNFAAQLGALTRVRRPVTLLGTASDVLLLVLGTGLYATPAVGGFVAVSQMIRQYGVCTEL